MAPVHPTPWHDPAHDRHPPALREAGMHDVCQTRPDHFAERSEGHREGGDPDPTDLVVPWTERLESHPWESDSDPTASTAASLGPDTLRPE